ncbi:MAG TPA: ABC transporter ATP-binding protein [Thermotogota bacterium]|nr:ABC transporter ATP-binding protein [Thermotogota bacterium]HPJ89475.1 ABC transporter ATP-binding protein [Thermotogota bacterium]
MNKKVVLELKNIWKIYEMGDIKVEALQDFSLQIEEGDYMVVMGPSGSGKSTFLQITGCLDKPTKGEVLIDGVNTSNMSDNQLAKVRNQKLGFVFQSFNLLSKMTAQENAALPLVYSGIPLKRRMNRAKELLEKVGLGERIHHKPNELSGGQQQRVAISRALANDPPVVLADEPTGNLDSKSSEEILKILENLHKNGKTIIVVTHDPDMVHCGNKVVHVLDGKIERIDINENLYAEERGR